jgi:hypothetical protein
LTAATALTIVLMIAATAACIAVVWLSKELVESARSLRVFADETRERLVPLLDKADITVDAANAELLRIDAAVTRFEDASVRVSAATGTLSEIVQAPAEIVTGVAGRVRRAWKERQRHAAAHDAPSTDVEQSAEEAEAPEETSEQQAVPSPADASGAHDESPTEDS